MPAEPVVASSSSWLPPPRLCPLQNRFLFLFGGLNQPVFETRLTEPRTLLRYQRPFTHLNAVVDRTRIRDHFARIVEGRQGLPHALMQTKYLRSPDFHGAIDRRFDCDSRQRT